MKYLQKGFTLVEISIVMTILFLMSSYLAVNYLNYYRGEENRQVEREIETIKNAIVNYAADNKTVNRAIEVVNELPLPIIGGANIVSVAWALPASRPYLPCPDIDGDGMEDRVPSIALTLMITLSAGAEYPLGEYPLEASGGCYSDRGTVPWRTLNTPPTDVWGNRYSYRVMPSFSNAIVGFDQTFRADSILYRPLTVRGADIDNIVIVSQSQVVSAAITTTVIIAPWAVGELRNYVGPAIICESSPCPQIVSITNNPPLIGTYHAVAAEIRIPNRANFEGNYVANYQVGALSDGVPFVVLSHGNNGYGAVRGNTPGYVCNPFPPGAALDPIQADEKQNALWYANATTDSIGQREYQCEVTNPANVDFSPGVVGVGFVAGVNSRASRTDQSSARHEGNDGYDDIVSWMSVDELINDLNEREVLPVQLLPPIGLEK